MHVRMVVALNMFDETEKRGDNVDYNRLSELFGVPMVPTTFTSGMGVKELFHQVIQLYEGAEDEEIHFRHIHINHGHEIEHGISEIQEHLKLEPNLRQRYSTRYLAIKLLEGDSDVEAYIKQMADAKEILHHRDTAAERVMEETGNDCETAIMDAKYGFINGALKEANYHTGNKKDTYQVTHLIDRVITNRFLGFPIFILLLFVMFSATFVLGQVPMDWIDNGVAALGEMLSKQLPDDEAIRGELEANGIDPTCDAGIVLAQVKRALNGDTKAAIWIRDILGENPGNRLTIDTDYLLTTPVANMDLTQLSDDELRAMIAAREELEEEGN